VLKKENMDINVASDIIQKAIFQVIIITFPILTIVFIVGLIISILQAATQINEMTLSFIPKMLAAILVLYFLSSWYLMKMKDFTENLWLDIPNLIKQ